MTPTVRSHQQRRAGRRSARVAVAFVATFLLASCAPDRSLAPSSDAVAARATLAIDDDEVSAAGLGGKASLTIIYNHLTDAPTDVPFTLEGKKVDQFALDDDAADPTLPSSTTLKLKPGTYVLRVGQIPGSDLIGINCSFSPGNTGSVNLPARTVTLTLIKGGTTTCTFTAVVPTSPI